MRNGKSRIEPRYVRSAETTRPSRNARSNHSIVRAPSRPAGMYLCVALTFRSLPCGRKVEHGRGAVAGNRRAEARRGAAVGARHANVAGFDRPRLVRLAPAHRSRDFLRGERLAKHPRQLEAARRANRSAIRRPRASSARHRSSRQRPAGAAPARTPSSRRASAASTSARCRQQSRSNSNETSLSVPVAFSARSRATASLSGRYASSGHRASRTIRSVLPLALRPAVGRAQPLRLDASCQPRGSRSRHVQVRNRGAPRVADLLRAQSESQARIAEHRDWRSVPGGTGIGFLRHRLRRTRAGVAARPRPRSTVPRRAAQSPTPAALPRRCARSTSAASCHQRRTLQRAAHLDACHGRSPERAMRRAAHRPTPPDPARGHRR